MYAIHRVTNDVTCITLPTPAPIARPFGYPVNVWLIEDTTWTLVDTGHRCARASLVAALAELGVAPYGISRILLTSYRPENIGNIDAFPNASVFGANPDDTIGDILSHVQRQRDDLRSLGYQLCDAAPEASTWHQGQVDELVDTYLPDELGTFPVVPLRSGRRISGERSHFEVFSTPGCDPGGLSYHEASSQQLFAGHVACLDPDAPIVDASAYAASLSRLAVLKPSAIFPLWGGIERHYAVAFRSLNLGINNFLGNLPMLLESPRSALELAYVDLGFWPRHIAHFMGVVMRFRSALHTLEAAGIVRREGDGINALYHVDSVNAGSPT